MPITTRLTALAACLALAGPAMAQAEKPAPEQRYSSQAIWFDPWVGYSRATLKVATPEGDITSEFFSTDRPIYHLPSGSPDGMYRYELYAVIDEEPGTRPRNTSTRPAPDASTGNPLGIGEEEMSGEPYYRTGSFRVERGAIKVPERAR